ncbi:trichohyalin isoform X2 [Colletes gigas]|uniref:trichohyalin isoform X2 n=1 Tax=Colletes gigas TaxID=935657 RepID=UPI001C9A36F5|nr:trichohyalin isoform X2 [Colletes gigas]
MNASMIHANDVTDLVDQITKVNIFSSSEKLRMSRDKEKTTFLDPNLIMDARHRIPREDLSVSSMKYSALAEAKRLLTQEQTKELYMKKQERFLKRELTKFETELHRYRSELFKPYICKKRNLAPSDDVDFWRTSRRNKNKIAFRDKSERNCSIGERVMETRLENSTTAEVNDSSLEAEDGKNSKTEECEISCVRSIKVTIKDKPNFESDTQRLCLLRKCFDALKQNAKEEQRIRGIKTKIQQSMAARIMKKYFDIWRMCTKNAKNRLQSQKEELSEERKIEKFINTITERQKELMKSQKDQKDQKGSSNADIRRKNVYCKPVVVESPAQSRLNAQKRIIEKQRAKLTEQNKMIEELKLTQTQKEISRTTKDTVNIVKEMLPHCGQGTRRTLIQLMQQSGYRDESLVVPRRLPDPPKFLLRMEARAVARRKRVKLAEESRRKKLEEQERKAEADRIEEEQKNRRIQHEEELERNRQRKEEEQNRQREIEKLKNLNNMADVFHRKYLLRHYVIEPLIILVEEKKSNIKKVDNHYRKNLIRKVFIARKGNTETRSTIIIETAEVYYNRSLIRKVFENWKKMAKETRLNYQVAIDFCNMKLLDRYFKSWKIIAFELKIQYEKKKKLAINHYELNLKTRYFHTWKKYLVIAVHIKESEKRKNELRQLVQTVIPDFDPKQRGVALED